MVRKGKCLNQKQFSNFDFKVFIYPRHCSLMGNIGNIIKSLVLQEQMFLASDMLLCQLKTWSGLKQRVSQKNALDAIVCLEDGFCVVERGQLGLKFQCLNFLYFKVFSWKLETSVDFSFLSYIKYFATGYLAEVIGNSSWFLNGSYILLHLCLERLELRLSLHLHLLLVERGTFTLL